jgi:FAD/FMN-containing dehydrogenase
VSFCNVRYGSAHAVITMMLADASFVTASRDQNPGLFWALRGSGNFGVITSFLYQLHPVKTAEPIAWD